MVNRELGTTGKIILPDVFFTVAGPTAWDNDAVVARILKKLAGKYGSARLCMVVGDEVGLDKIAQAQARHIGIHCVVIPTLHSSYYRDAPRLAELLKLQLLDALAFTGEFEPKGVKKEPFLVAFYWDLSENRSTRNAMVLAKRAGVRIAPVKVGKQVGMLSAEAWYKMKKEREKAKRKKR